MCNHYAHDPVARAALQTWREYIGWAIDRPLPPELQTALADIWPRRDAMVVRQGPGGAFVDVMQWGVPLTLPGKRPGTALTKYITNVRNLASSFWSAILTDPAQRCLVPFTSFAEPMPNAGRAEAWFKIPSQPVAAFAGIWRPTDDGAVFAFLTCAPNPLVAPIHPKAMPVILHPEDYQNWLNGADAQRLAHPFPSQMMELVPK